MSKKALLVDIEATKNKKVMKFSELLKISTRWFGVPRSKGTSHHFFKMPWQGLPMINLQRIGKDAKDYQIRQVNKALIKLLELKTEGDK